MQKSSGILMPIFSLPNAYGIGTLGKAAYDFADFLSAAGQSYWQILPLGPTGYGDSPYQSFSTYAGNPYFIDFELLVQAGLISEADLATITWNKNATSIDYGGLYQEHKFLLQQAFQISKNVKNPKMEKFCSKEATWLDNYAFFMALKQHFAMQELVLWPKEIRLRQAEAMEYYQGLLKEEIAYEKFVQFLFAEQWSALKDYVHSLGIKIIGDLPIYVALDSADVWQEPTAFLLNEELLPTEVAGVPPDCFSATGQLWGNPLYAWAELAKNGYAWWISRLAKQQELFDIVRIDHFRGLASYWAVPNGAKTAENGAWKQGPGIALIKEIKAQLPGLQIIAEDLGLITEDVKEFLAESGYSGMKVLQFGLLPEEDSEHLPHNYGEKLVAYTGTHDNPPIMGWLESATVAERNFASSYFSCSQEEGQQWGIIKGMLASEAELIIIPIQDFLGLGLEARINLPATLGNWQWRLQEGVLTKILAKRIKKITQLYKRLG
ncbi:MAG: 4-alpha-glucanotransferase [Clostridia bacterium]